MRFKSALLFTALVTIPLGAFAAEPQRDLQSGLNYTTFGYKDDEEKTRENTEAQKAETPDAPEAPKSPQKAAVAKPQKPTLTGHQDPEEEQSAEVRIWNKYKALAAGQAKKPSDTNEEKTATAEEGKTAGESQAVKGSMKSWHAPEAEQEETPELQETKQVSGISAILNEWQTSKNQQREMRTKHFAVPEGIGTSNKEKPEEKPEETPKKP